MSNQDIVFSETDGFSRNKLLFQKLTDQPLVTSTKPTRGTKFADSTAYSILKEVFLPQGFPHSVHRDYVSYQIWDTLQDFASTINGTLTTHSVMRSFGVGDSTATPTAAAITWILKDGTGMLGGILFAWWQGNKLGSQCKKWRFFADILNDLAFTIEVMIPYIFFFHPSYCLCVTTGMKSIVGIAGGATRTAMTQHLAISDNLADVHAKESSQATIVNLAGSIIGILILSYLNERFFLPLCMLLVVIHLLCNYFAVTSLKINTLNEDRLCFIVEEFLLNNSISNVDKINKLESVFIFKESPAKRIFGFDLECGASLEQLVKMKIIDSKDFNNFFSIFLQRKYLPIMDLKKRRIFVILSDEVTDDEILKAYFHSYAYASIISSLTNFPAEVLKKIPSSLPHPMTRIVKFFEKYYVLLSESDSRVPFEIVSAVDEAVSKESDMFFKLLSDSEWARKANMLRLQSWRSACKLC